MDAFFPLTYRLDSKTELDEFVSCFTGQSVYLYSDASTQLVSRYVFYSRGALDLQANRSQSGSTCMYSDTLPVH